MSQNNSFDYLRKLITWPGVLVTIMLSTGALVISFKAGDILSQVVAAGGAFTSGTTTLFLTPYDDMDLAVGETERIDVNINTRTAINALGVTIKFPTDLLEVVGFSKEKSFLNLWTEDTAIHEDVGEIHFSGGTTKKGGIIGTGTVLTILVKSKNFGRATLEFENTEIFPSDGSGKTIDDETRSLTFTIRDASNKDSEQDVVHNSSSQSIIDGPKKPTGQNPDVNEDGAINLVDISIMVMRLVMPYDPRFDLNSDGLINAGDVSVVLSKTR